MSDAWSCVTCLPGGCGVHLTRGSVPIPGCLPTVQGPDTVKFLEKLLVADLAEVQNGTGSLSVFTNDAGGIVDDTVLTKVARRPAATPLAAPPAQTSSPAALSGGGRRGLPGAECGLQREGR